MWKVLLLAWLVLLPAALAGAAPPALFHSFSDTGGNPGVPVTVGPGTGVVLHLYLDVGETASTIDPCNQGDGDEICGYRLTLLGTGVAFQTFTPADPDVVFNLAAGELQLTGGDFQTGDLGPTKIGDLVLDSTEATGGVQLVLGEFVTTQLSKETASVPVDVVLLPEPAGSVALACGVGLLIVLQRRRSRSSPYPLVARRLP